VNIWKWSTDEPHRDNSETMTDYLNTEMDPSWIIDLVDGSYAEITTDCGDEYALHASGDGNFNDHKVSFVRL
jgi:hypothetical protein